ncbi:hypothetical protein BH10ACT10_BH10ACT10_19290 [soil metagenome]
MIAVVVLLVLVCSVVLVVVLTSGHRDREVVWVAVPVVGLVLCAPLLMFCSAGLLAALLDEDEVSRGIGLLVVTWVGPPTAALTLLLLTAVVQFRRRPLLSRLLCAVAGAALLAGALWGRSAGGWSLLAAALGLGLLVSAVLRPRSEYRDVAQVST